MVQLTLRIKRFESVTKSHQKITFVIRNDRGEDLSLKKHYQSYRNDDALLVREYNVQIW